MTGRIDPVDLLVSAATAGAFHGATGHFDYLKVASNASTKTFAQHLALNMTRSAINGTVNAAFGRDVKIFDVAVNGLASAVGAWGASEIGGSTLTGIERRVAHGFTQGLVGYTLDHNNPERGMATGFASGFMAPTILEWVGGTPEERFAGIRTENPTADPETLYTLGMESVKRDMKMTQLLTTAGVGILGGNPMLASTTSYSVMENNCCSVLSPMLSYLASGAAVAGGGVVVLEGGKKLSKAYASYKEKQLYDLENVLHNESGDNDQTKEGSSGHKDSGGSGGGPSGSDMSKAATVAMATKQAAQEAGKRFKVLKPRISGKEGAKDVPGAIKHFKPYVGESGKKFAKRVVESLGGSVKETGPKSLFNRVKKWADRAFIDPK